MRPRLLALPPLCMRSSRKRAAFSQDTFQGPRLKVPPPLTATTALAVAGETVSSTVSVRVQLVL